MLFGVGSVGGREMGVGFVPAWFRGYADNPMPLKTFDTL
jgi:hypothetical protein